MVFYLKYRPQKIADLDLAEIRTNLKKLVESGKIPHALLFAGPRGCGKTSAARIIAKAVNCSTNKGKGEPCNRCSICQEITRGSLVDLIEIDGASNRGIDDVRSLRENVKLAPSRAKFKVYIIDEVQMLTTEAFNALLKTLEEPPAHVLFILCTTAPEKLPETIISRCVRFNFRKAKPKEVESALKRVVKGEKLKAEEGVLEMIAEKVDGDFRDGKKILDQLAATGKKIGLSETKELLGQIESLSPLRLLKALAQKDVKAGLLEISRLFEAGADLKVYLQNFLELLRLVLVARVGAGEFQEPKETRELSDQEIKRLVRDFSRVGTEIKTAIIPQLPFELAVIEWSQGQTKTVSVDQKSGPGEPTGNDFQKSSSVRQKTQIGGGVDLKEIEKQWPEVLTQVRPLNHSVSALLKACRPLGVKGEILTLEVFYRFHKERLETEKCRSIVEGVVENIFGSPIKIKCILGKRKQDFSTSSAQPEESKEDLGNGLSSDLLSAAEEIFNGKMVD